MEKTRATNATDEAEITIGLTLSGVCGSVLDWVSPPPPPSPALLLMLIIMMILMMMLFNTGTLTIAVIAAATAAVKNSSNNISVNNGSPFKVFYDC